MKYSFSIPTRAFKACKLATSSDPFRQVLHGINLSADKRGLYMTTTNGRMLVSIRLDDYSKKEADAFNVILKQFMPEPNHLGESLIHLDTEARNVKYATGFQPTIDLMEGNYPAWREVLTPNVTEGESTINPLMISDLVKAAIIWSKKKEGIRIHTHGTDQAHVRIVNDTSFVGILMPMTTTGLSSSEFMKKFKNEQ